MAATARPPQPGDSSPQPDVPVRLAVGRFAEYGAAQRAVKRLHAARIPGDAVRVVACGLRRRDEDASETIVDGLVRGAAFGTVFALVWWLIGLADAGPFIALVSGAIVGALLGGFAVLGMRALAHGEDDVVEVERFDVLVDADFEGDARPALADGQG